MKTLLLQYDYFKGELVKGVFFYGRQGDTIEVEDHVANQVLRDFPKWFSVLPIPEPVEEVKMVAGSPEDKMVKTSRRAVKHNG